MSLFDGSVHRPSLPFPSWQQLISRELRKDWESALPTFTPEDKGLATRQHSQTMLNALAPALPGLIGEHGP
jgi:transketolase